jgi:hypothetical protein
MDKKIIAGAVALFLVSWFVLLKAPEDTPDTPTTLPWNITHPSPDTTLVFGVTLGKTTLDEAAHIFKHEADTEISLFKPSEGNMSVEVFIEEVNFNGLKAKMTLTVALEPAVMQGMFERGLRMNSTPSGKRITLTAEDLVTVRNAPLSSLTYLPAARLDEAIITKRFGTPSEKIRETTSGVMHWLYAQHGLDVVLNGNEKPILQYVPLKDFGLLRTPLLKNGEIIKDTQTPAAK